MIDNLKKTAVRITRISGNDIGYLLNLPIREFMKLVEMFIEVSEEEREARKEAKKR